MSRVALAVVVGIAAGAVGGVPRGGPSTRGSCRRPIRPGSPTTATPGSPASTCHPARAVAAGQVRPPGVDGHAPCDRSGCHRKAFTRPPGPLCRVCHESVDPTGARPSPLRDYPPTGAWRAEPSRFSHAVHLDKGKMERAVGFHVACEDCHAPGGAYPGVGGHAECARCHAAEVGLHGAPTMADCAGCHAPGVAERNPRRLIRGDLRFDHRRHVDRPPRQADRVRDLPRRDRVRDLGHRPPAAADRGVRRLPRRLRPGPGDPAHADLRDLPHLAQRVDRRARAALAPAGDRDADRPHPGVPHRPRRGRQGRPGAVRALPHPDVGQPGRRPATSATRR